MTERKIVKIIKEDDIRKFEMEQESFEYLKQTIEKLYQISNFIMQYKDEDGDLCRISSDLELNLALKEQMPLKIYLKLEIVKNEEKTAQDILQQLKYLGLEVPTYENETQNEELFPDFFQKDIIQTLSGATKHEKEDKSERRKLFASTYKDKLHSKK